ncbi:MAG: penicillin-binding protein, partial [Hyphomicrobium sp.]|nr:penicillin-binding protein [Hyphomicrobium sp.]
YGIEAASQRYFEKSARELTLAESAVIAGLLKAPSKYSPNASPGAARSRGRSVLNKMLAAGYIRAADEKRALAERVKFAEAKPGKEMNGVEYAVDFVLERMPPLVGAGHAEVVVETTIDADLQKQTHAIVTRKLAAQARPLSSCWTSMEVSAPWSAGDPMPRASTTAWSRHAGNRALRSRRSSTSPHSKAD